MTTPLQALAWEFRQRHRLALIVFGSYTALVALYWSFAPAPVPGTGADLEGGIAATVSVPFAIAFLYLLAVFSFGLDGDVFGRPSLFPSRLFTLPVSTRALAGFPMLFGGVAIGALCVAANVALRWMWEVELPFVWPALLGVVVLAWAQAFSWSPFPLPGLRVLLSVLLLVGLAAVVIVAIEWKTPEASILAILAPQVPAAHALAQVAVRRARRGDAPVWTAMNRATSGGARPAAFRSAEGAQAWFEWRQEGWILPVSVATILPFVVGALFAVRDEPLVLTFEALLFALLAPPFLAGFAGAIAGRAGREGEATSGASFTLVRPMTSAAIVRAKFRVAAGSALLAWALVLVTIPGTLHLAGTTPRIAARLSGLVELDPPRYVAFGLAVILALVVSTWKQLVQSLFVHLAGRRWMVHVSSVARLFAVAVAFPLVADWILDTRRRSLPYIVEGWPWVLGFLAIVKLAAYWRLAPRLRAEGIADDRWIVIAAAGWLTAVAAAYLFLVWLVSTPPLVSRTLPALLAILAIPLVRISAAPLALSRSRHRGAESFDRSPVVSNRALDVARALVTIPLAVTLFEAVTHARVHANNGVLMTADGPREFFLHVPSTYDASRPSPLVISLHGGATWPTHQRHSSGWNAVADREGFLVVYPEGTGSPRAWHMSPGGIERNARFIAALIDDIAARYNVDRARIYADGLSNGGGMAVALSCRMPDRLAAVGMVAAAHLTGYFGCDDARPVPMIAVHGVADATAPYAGGRSWVVPQEIPSIESVMARFARRNRCRPEPLVTIPMPDVVRREYAGCAQDASVVLYAIRDAGHVWPGGGPLPTWVAGHDPGTVSATELLWAFYKSRSVSPADGPRGGAAD